MLSTYEAILKGNRLEWSKVAPEQPLSEKGVVVYVTILDQSPPLSKGTIQGQRMAAALEQLAAIPVLAYLDDPAAWEREMRQDRPLPHREP